MKKFIFGFLCVSLFTTLFPSDLTEIKAVTFSQRTCTTLKECEDIIGGIEDEVTQIEQVETEKENEKEDLQSQRFHLRDEVTKIQTNIIELKQDINVLQDEITSNESKRDELEGEIKILRKKVNSVIILDAKMQRQNLFLTIISESESLIDLIRNAQIHRHIASQTKGYIEDLSVLVQEQNKVIDRLESDKNVLVTKRQELEKDESNLVKKMEDLIAIEKQIQKELQKLQSMKMEANEIKEIMEEQKTVIVASSNDTFGIPLETGYVSCEFSCYVDSSGVPHNGIDLGNYGNTTTKVLASASGTVARSGWHVAYGNHVMITHNINGNTFTTVYAHMNSAPLVSTGESVKKGQQLGTMGTTGNSSGPHLHFELYEGYYNWPHSVNPRDYVTFPSRW